MLVFHKISLEFIHSGKALGCTYVYFPVHFKPANFIAVKLDRPYSLMRQPDEKLQKCILRVQAQAAKFDFGDSLDSALRNRLISGINNASLNKRLLLFKNLTFLAARILCAQYEELQEAVEEPQSSMYNSRLKSRRKILI